ncbi:unnamed protein product [Parnassius mnemosyne]|uniref:RING-type domain-containing protein n=1 Tax=Parnassius mnemosyne TaxID=213953 RepID=A0AAV1LZU1_9NEOP
MGCAVSGVHRTTMLLFGKNSSDTRAKLERKLYLAKESPEPEFDISGCELRQLPPGIFSICKVFRKDHLYLQNNCLNSLEHGGQLSDLHHIKILDLSCNRFLHLSNDIRYLVNLTELYIHSNLLKAIPENIKYLECLRVLDVSNNKLTSLTTSLGELQCLNTLKITQNDELYELCPELCLARNLAHIDLDGENFTFPPIEIAVKDTETIMKFLCEALNIEYVLPSNVEANISVRDVSRTENLFSRRNTTSWEEQETAIIEQEKRIHRANQQQRDKFLSKIIQEQLNLDSEIAKVHEDREVERQRLIKAIQKDEKEIDVIVKKFIQSDGLKPEIIQQQLAYEKAEHDRLLEITRQNYDNIRKTDILKAMKNLIRNENSFQFYFKNYRDNLNNIRENVVIQELENNVKLLEFLDAKDNSRAVLVQELLEDEDIQKAIVTSLLEKVDSKTWSLNQEISLISSNLARLSAIEQEKKKLHIAYNYNELLQQRVQLVNLLDDLFEQKIKRRKQLIDTIREVEIKKDMSTDFWLKNYQKLIDSAPKNLLGVSKQLDPLLANYLLQEDVIHCLPFLVKFLFSDESLANITTEQLKDNGVTLSVDRDGIVRAIKLYMSSKLSDQRLEISGRCNDFQPTAPYIDDVNIHNCSGVLDTEKDQDVLEGECVVCMDAKSEVVFVPCGHMCCCQSCGMQQIDLCPMCRINIERKIKVLIS